LMKLLQKPLFLYAITTKNQTLRLRDSPLMEPPSLLHFLLANVLFLIHSFFFFFCNSWFLYTHSLLVSTMMLTGICWLQWFHTWQKHLNAMWENWLMFVYNVTLFILLTVLKFEQVAVVLCRLCLVKNCR
jgi:hypothetical protein